MKNSLRKLLVAILAVVFIGSTGMYIYHNAQMKAAEESYHSAEELADIPEEMPEEIIEVEEPETELEKGWHEVEITNDEYMSVLGETDIASLKEVNEDVLGWIAIPDTQLSYPLMEGRDNSYYLSHTWDNKPSSAGSVFVEKYNSTDLSDYHTIIYGHRMNNGAIFGSLKGYESRAYFEQHPYVYIYDVNGVHRYEIFSVYEAEVGSRTYQVGFKNEESKQNFINYCVESSVYDTGIVPTIDDKILTLSTCTAVGHEKKRWVVQARLQGMVVE
ncbi:MAG: class B sortase [Firmicutes bacterium]|nr:class B sortase [Bacillota bacterium]